MSTPSSTTTSSPHRNSHLLAPLLFFFGLTASPLASAQDAEVLKSRVLTAIRQAALTSPPLDSYRVEGTLTFFDGAGKNPQRGSFDVRGKESNLRLTVTFPGATTSFLQVGGKRYNSSQGVVPYFTNHLMQFLLTPRLVGTFGTVSALEVRNLPRAASAECVSVNNENAITRGPVAPIHEICLDKGVDDLRVLVNGAEQYLRDDIVTFGGQRPAKRVQLRVGGILVGDAQITKLDFATLDPQAFAPTPEMKLEPAPPTVLSGAIMAGRIMHHENPKYPKLARAAHIQGVVVLRAIIDIQGHISNLAVISSPDPLLSEASLKAVNQWTYEPYLLNGKPTEVDTTITVNFAIGK